MGPQIYHSHVCIIDTFNLRDLEIQARDHWYHIRYSRRMVSYRCSVSHSNFVSKMLFLRYSPLNTTIMLKSGFWVTEGY